MPVLETYAVNSKLNKDKFSECLLNKKFEQEIKNMNVEIEEFGISGVPVYFVNGEKFEGVPTYEGMKAMIDKALTENVATTNSSDETTTNSNN
jgi:protein-disulfide isomerase